MRFLLTILTIQLGLLSFGQQDSITIEFIPTFNNEVLVLNKNYPLNLSNDSAKISKLKFYVSNFSISNSDTSLYPNQTRGYLVDIENSLQLKLPIDTMIVMDSVTFNLGIDSLTNNGGALSGDLDPINGMYWAWQSGYINFKLEGTSPACYARKNKFQLHVGGYLSPFNSMQDVTLPLTNPRSIQIEIPIDKLLSYTMTYYQYTIMSPSADAVNFSKYIKNVIKVK